MQVEDKFEEWQCGFQPDRGTMDLVLIQKMILEKELGMGHCKGYNAYGYRKALV